MIWDDTKDLLRPGICNWDSCKCDFSLNDLRIKATINFSRCNNHGNEIENEIWHTATKVNFLFKITFSFLR